jgi:hypothetical protein
MECGTSRKGNNCKLLFKTQNASLVFRGEDITERESTVHIECSIYISLKW